MKKQSLECKDNNARDCKGNDAEQGLDCHASS